LAQAATCQQELTPVAPVATPVRNTSAPASVEATPGDGNSNDDGSKDPATLMPAPTEPEKPSVLPGEKEPAVPVQELGVSQRKAILRSMFCASLIDLLVKFVRHFFLHRSVCQLFAYIWSLDVGSNPTSSDRLD